MQKTRKKLLREWARERGRDDIHSLVSTPTTTTGYVSNPAIWTPGRLASSHYRPGQWSCHATVCRRRQRHQSKCLPTITKIVPTIYLVLYTLLAEHRILHSCAQSHAVRVGVLVVCAENNINQIGTGGMVVVPLEGNYIRLVVWSNYLFHSPSFLGHAASSWSSRGP